MSFTQLCLYWKPGTRQFLYSRFFLEFLQLPFGNLQSCLFIFIYIIFFEEIQFCFFFLIIWSKYDKVLNNLLKQQLTKNKIKWLGDNILNYHSKLGFGFLPCFNMSFLNRFLQVGKIKQIILSRSFPIFRPMELLIIWIRSCC